MARLALVFFAISAIVSGQSSEAVLSGTVGDTSGAVMPGVAVVLENAATGVRHEGKSNDSGVYVFPGLQPGIYRLSAEQDGFKRAVYSGIKLEVGARLQLNVKMEVGAVAESVQVTAEDANLLGYATASVGGMLSGQKVLDLPLPARNALSLVYTQAGLLGDNFAGSRIAAVNVTLDGVNVQDQRNNNGVSSPVFTSVDRVEEFRIITAPADAEFGRGSGQVQMLTRSGTNQFHGSLFEFHRNTVLNANTWFNNQRGTDARTGEPISPRNNLIRNQFGGRIGGAIVKNKTFFHFLYDAQRIHSSSAVTQTVFTEAARQGMFRFFPGVRNGNAESLSPTVDLLGNPVRPGTATGDLQSVRLFGLDPNRTGADPTGTVQRLFGVMPLPNNFRTGDGLNTAGYTWRRPSIDNFDVWNVKFDHTFSSAHRISYTYNIEDEYEFNTRYEQRFPEAPGGNIKRRDHFHTLAFLSTLRSNVLNEFRVGVLRPDYRAYAPWELEENANFLPKAGSTAYIPVFNLVSSVVVDDDDPVRLFSPFYQFTDNVTWIRGKHAFKGGVDARFPSSNSFNSSDVMPRVNFGTGGTAILNLERIAGIGQNLANARNMLNDLSGSVANVVQALNATGGAKPAYEPGLYKYRHWKRKELSLFFKDDFKVTPNFTLNIGVRWEYYGVPFDPNGRTASLEGGSASIFGLSGTSFADLYQPGHLTGSLTRVNLIGPKTANPGRKLYNEDYNNFAPAVGFSWALPWFQRKTVFRAGYGIAYERQSLRLVDVVSGDQPARRERVVYTQADYMDMRSVRFPLAPQGVPLETIPVTDRSQTVRVFDQGLRTPYIQNWNATLQREVGKGMVVEARYVGSKATKLLRGADVNERNIFENGLLDAYLVTQAGGNSPLLDRIFNGINVAGLGVVNGTTIRGSDAMRAISLTQGYLSGNNVATFAEYLNTNTAFTNVRGGLLRRAGLPENFVMANPQFSSARLTGNYANSTFHSLQMEFSKRFSSGWTFQGNYTFSKALGEEDGDGDSLNLSYRSSRDRSLDKKLLGFHRTHIARTSGTFELPMGPGKLLFRNARGFWARLVERWQVGNIINLFSGDPITITSGRASFNSFNAASTPASAATELEKNLGAIVRTGRGVAYFSGLQQVRDPYVARITAVNGIQAASTMQAIADASGRLLLVNAVPGSPGTMGVGFFEGPGAVRFDLNVVKRVRMTERLTLELRGDAISALNKPNFSNPNADINSVNFGRITGTDDGNRIMVVSARINF
ncbi:MAG: carboxypeptidase regulatory-like domain-containing protein [Acidobacteria bacterium]|nr:carboxypeptidase regulatory-like domain-containing protein [Acidobacteriota bacterium]